jgi:methionyl-tRNA formyltransferase
MAEQLRLLRIVFMGTPEFAVATLDYLYTHGCNIVGVVTIPDKPSGRGQQINISAVKKYALEKSLPLLQPEKLRDPDFLEALRSLKADIQVVVAFRMLPEIVWNMPPMGTINLHGSLLPDYRGAAPINWAIINGEEQTGATTFFIQKDIDTGDILKQQTIPISPDMNAGELHDIMKEVGAKLVFDTLHDLSSGEEVRRNQQSHITLSKIAPKITKEDTKIDFNQPCQQVHNFVRGLSPYPTAFTIWNNKILKIYTTSIDLDTPSNQQIISDNKTYLKFKCLDGYLNILSLQLEGKKRMDIEDFLRGNKI